MKRILVTGALGQLGSELTPYLRERYGGDNVVATDLRDAGGAGAREGGPFYRLDCRSGSELAAIIRRHRVDTIYHLAALLSATGEANPQAAWDVAAYIRRYIPEFEIAYQVDPVRQALANSWPNNLEDYAARVEWGWDPRYDLDAMTRDMLGQLQRKES